MLLTNSEIEKMKKMFLELDTTNDGFLSIEEINEGLGAVLGQFRANTVEMKDFVQKMDSNHDGKVDFQEFIAAAIHRDIAFQKQHIFTTFKLFDINGDGRISIDELKAVF